MRRYEVDYIRTLALLLLIFYHIAVSFQPGIEKFLFVPNPYAIQSSAVMDMVGLLSLSLQIWRIPIVFVIAGMGAFFSLENRNLSQFLGDRGARIGLPMIFGSVFIAPLVPLFFYYHYQGKISLEFFWIGAPVHLWFLINILIYCVIIAPIWFYLKPLKPSYLVRLRDWCMEKRLGIILLLSLPMITSTVIIKPTDFAQWWFGGPDTMHGLSIGLICFTFGFVAASVWPRFANTVRRTRYISLIIAACLFLTRVASYDESINQSQELFYILTSIESANWILCVIGFTSTYLSTKSRWLLYLTPAVYPMYIIHLPLQNYLSTIVSRLDLPAPLRLIIMLTTTIFGSLLFYETIKRIRWFRVCFGLKP